MEGRAGEGLELGSASRQSWLRRVKPGGGRFHYQQLVRSSMIEQRFPPGWDEKRVREVLAHYEDQSEDEEFAEIEAALTTDDITMVELSSLSQRLPRRLEPLTTAIP